MKKAAWALVIAAGLWSSVSRATDGSAKTPRVVTLRVPQLAGAPDDAVTRVEATLKSVAGVKSVKTAQEDSVVSVTLTESSTTDAATLAKALEGWVVEVDTRPHSFHRAAVVRRCLHLLDPKFNDDAQTLSDGSHVVAADADDSDPAAPLLLVLLNNLPADQHVEDGHEGRLYVLGSSPKSGRRDYLKVPIPDSNQLFAILEPASYEVGPGAQAVVAYISSYAETEGESRSMVVARRLEGRIEPVISVSRYDQFLNGPGGWTQMKFEVVPGSTPGFATFAARFSNQESCPDEGHCGLSSEPPPSQFACWDGAKYASATSVSCLFKAATASSSLTEGKKVHAPALALDGDKGTAWCKARESAIRDSWWQVEILQPRRLAKLTLLPGYARNEDAWANNNRIKTALVTFDDRPPQQVSFTDVMGPQDVLLPPGLGAVSRVRVQPIEVVRGKKFDDTCVSEVAFEFAH